jgi:hypothetical protein
MRVSILVVNVFSTKCGFAMLTGHHTAGGISLGPVLLLLGLTVVLAVLRCVIAFPEWHRIMGEALFFLKYLGLGPVSRGPDAPSLYISPPLPAFSQVLREGSLIRSF